jgi:hypothetical protein
MLLRFEFCHREQVMQVIEPVLLRKPGQISDDVGNETRRLVGAAIAGGLARKRSPTPGQ